MLIFTYFLKVGLGFSVGCALVILVTLFIYKRFNYKVRINKGEL